MCPSYFLPHPSRMFPRQHNFLWSTLIYNSLFGVDAPPHPLFSELTNYTKLNMESSDSISIQSEGQSAKQID